MTALNSKYYLKTEKEIQLMLEGGKILVEIGEALKEKVKIGCSAWEIDQLAEKLFKKFNVQSAFKNYQPEGMRSPFPANVCVSVNEVVAHGRPTKDLIFTENDLVKIDLGLKYKNFYLDGAFTINLDKDNQLKERLKQTTLEALKKAISVVAPGKFLNEIGKTIEEFVSLQGFKVIKNLCGHGIGKNLHESPQVYNFKKQNSLIKMKPGLVFTIEPMVSVSSEYVIKTPQESYATDNGSLSAHFEITIAVTKQGKLIITPFKFLKC